MPAVTRAADADLGSAVRVSVVRGAQLADSLDEKWERFSDRLRDKSKCDETTGRRLFDNGFRKDGSRVGNPVLGALCKAQPLQPLAPALAAAVLACAERAATQTLGVSRDALRTEAAAVGAFARARRRSAFDVGDSSVTPAFEPPPTLPQADQDAQVRFDFNGEAYAALKAASKFATNGRASSAAFEAAWGKELLAALAAGSSRRDFKSPFPPPDPSETGRAYDDGKLLDALGALSASLRALEAGGLCGRWEISVPADDDGDVVTVAVDDDVTLPAQFLLREQGAALSGSAVLAVVRAALDQAGIACRTESFFLDPSTTKQSVYQPTQLLVSLSNLRQK